MRAIVLYSMYVHIVHIQPIYLLKVLENPKGLSYYYNQDSIHTSYTIMQVLICNTYHLNVNSHADTLLMMIM